MISYLLPTHNRHERLRQTLDAIGSLCANAHASIGGGEMIVVDNASAPPVECPLRLDNDLPVRVIRLERNLGAAARNIAAERARSQWIVMLDDDSYACDCRHIEAIATAPDDVAAIGAEIMLPNGAREAGGLPEVFIGCGVAIRRDAFLAVGGYDPSFDYYAEEYDLCAKLILQGWRIMHDFRFRVRHEKVMTGRDMNLIVQRLVRNNGWVMQRYAPLERRQRELAEIITRYARIAVKENAACGFVLGVAELLRTLDAQPARHMSDEMFDRFTGLAHVRNSLRKDSRIKKLSRVAVIDEGKNAWAVRQALREIGAVIVASDAEDADAHVIGTLSPGPMLDAWRRRGDAVPTVVRPW